MLKTLCGTIAAKLIKEDVNTINTYGIKNQWLDILVGNENFSGTMGLYIEGGIGQDIGFADKFGFTPLFNDSNRKQVIGASFIMSGLIFHLIMENNASHIPEHWRNPFRILVLNLPNKRKRGILFSW